MQTSCREIEKNLNVSNQLQTDSFYTSFIGSITIQFAIIWHFFYHFMHICSFKNRLDFCLDLKLWSMTQPINIDFIGNLSIVKAR